MSCPWPPRASSLSKTMRDPYETLGISPTAAADDIKTAYRKAARLYHPDRNPEPGAADRFRLIQAAYDILSDDAKRRDYDALRRRNLIDDPLQEATSLWASYIEKVIS
ncbi:DnaJ domain-containing protein [Zoogloea sp.]|nr:DnaJ domain-containing protein [Zoogloea sp.]HOY01517.1 DnaJ domain-containing protein [Zoogloea sp.]HPI60407.1 DnaJ domain-containing protein [Zoogloea sp.]